MYKYSLESKSEAVISIYEVNDLDMALNLFIRAYQSNLFDHIDLSDTTTGEVMAYYDDKDHDLWQSDEVTDHMLKVIFQKGDLEKFLKQLFD